ncbi:MAG: Asp-tRNA(Asn)/Glu-tRNA(Gln) amidotransferase GatCAB subunit A, partial [Burkholderiales bacterium]
MIDSSLRELSRQLAEKKISSAELTRDFLDRIKRHNGAVNAFITVDEEKTLAQARAADRLIARGQSSPL